MITTRFPRLSAIRAVLSKIHAVDKSLIIFMVVLLAQSAYSIFFQSSASPAASDIDVVVRTSSAAIFGYFLSANFVSRSTQADSTPFANGRRTVETVESGEASDSLRGQIGFSAEPSEPLQGGIQTQGQPAAQSTSIAGYLQVAAATGIGLFCLLTLILVRNTTHGSAILTESSAAAATVVQFRDFVSGCVGFLIGCPTHQNEHANSSA